MTHLSDHSLRLRREQVRLAAPKETEMMTIPQRGGGCLQKQGVEEGKLRQPKRGRYREVVWLVMTARMRACIG